MLKRKRNLCPILMLVVLVYIVLTIILGNQVQAGNRTEDLSNLINYPEIYIAVQELKTAHPNWTFTILYTGLDWNTVIENETTKLHTRSLIHKSLVLGDINDWVCETCGANLKESGSWYCASKKTVSYYIDPRNWINDTYIFAFETLSFNENVHTLEGVQSILEGTFMDTDTITYLDSNGESQIINKSYAQIIYDAGKVNNVSPYHLAARIRQEHGSGGSSLITGNYTYVNDETKEEIVYKGYYNYFNIGASGTSSSSIIKNGLDRAVDEGWTNPELAIIGGAEFLKGGYIGNYQDTLYLQKYHVDNASKYSLYNHQYQQNISAPYTESLDVYDAYEELGILESNFNFVIPVYENMPSTASVKPGINMEITTADVIVNTQTTDLSIRRGPSVDSYIKATAPKGTRLVRIEKAIDVSSDGRYWDKVVYNTGTEIIIGYASREYLLDTEIIEVTNESKEITVTCNLRNGPSTTNTYVKQILQKGTKITIIDKLTFKEDGHIWYRVKLEDGTQGYVSSEYISKEKYKIEENNIIIQPDTVITDIPDAVLVGEILGTGAKIKIGENEYTVIMLGDTNGDGNITPADYVKIKNNIMGTTTLDTEYKLAADVNRDGNVSPADYVKVKNHIMNVSKISV